MDKTKILIIDDEEGILRMYKIKFDEEGFETMTSLSGQSGIEIAKEKKTQPYSLGYFNAQF